ncbi:MAG: hypothetical protein ACFB10_10165 [Salibacteraceae bacterium]
MLPIAGSGQLHQNPDATEGSFMGKKFTICINMALSPNLNLWNEGTKEIDATKNLLEGYRIKERQGVNPKLGISLTYSLTKDIGVGIGAHTVRLPNIIGALPEERYQVVDGVTYFNMIEVEHSISYLEGGIKVLGGEGNVGPYFSLFGRLGVSRYVSYRTIILEPKTRYGVMVFEQERIEQEPGSVGLIGIGGGLGKNTVINSNLMFGYGMNCSLTLAGASLPGSTIANDWVTMGAFEHQLIEFYINIGLNL